MALGGALANPAAVVPTTRRTGAAAAAGKPHQMMQLQHRRRGAAALAPPPGSRRRRARRGATPPTAAADAAATPSPSITSAPEGSREADVLDALRNVIDPDFGEDVVNCGFVKDLLVSAGGRADLPDCLLILCTSLSLYTRRVLLPGLARVPFSAQSDCLLRVYRCACTHSSLPLTWPGHPCPACLLIVYRCARARSPRPPPWPDTASSSHFKRTACSTSRYMLLG